MGLSRWGVRELPTKIRLERLASKRDAQSREFLDGARMSEASGSTATEVEGWMLDEVAVALKCYAS